MKTPRIGRSATLRGRRGIVLFVSGAIAMGIGVAGVRALASDSPASQKHVEAEGPATPTPVVPPAVTDPSPSVTPTEPSPSAEPAPDPNALADGVYPTFVRAVDVQGGTVTVDVLQVFVGADQHQAAIEDGVPWADVRYDPVYIRNENPLLRTLPVDRDVQIQFIATCMSPSRWVGLTELGKQTANFDETFYYEMSVSGWQRRGHRAEDRHLGVLRGHVVRSASIRAVARVSVALTLASCAVASTPTTHEAAKGSLVIHGTGDVSLDPSQIAAFRTHGYDWAWSGLGGLFSHDDLTMVNLECPATDIVDPEPKAFTFRCDPQALPAARRAGVDVVSQANNHAYDQGPAGLVDSLDAIRAAGLTSVGAGSRRVGGAACGEVRDPRLDGRRGGDRPGARPARPGRGSEQAGDGRGSRLPARTWRRSATRPRPRTSSSS